MLVRAIISVYVYFRHYIVRFSMEFNFRWCFLACIFMGLSACSENPWNNPYPQEDDTSNIYYSSFSERPKHLDPVSSYSEGEAIFTAQIYEPVVQYHFFDRPYRLVSLTAEQIPVPVYLNERGEAIGADAPDPEIAEVVYRINIKKGIQYQPHPSLAKSKDGRYMYHDLNERGLDKISVLSDFELSGTRELIADDYVYQIKRLMLPSKHSPVAGFMAKYIKDFTIFGERLRTQNSLGEPAMLSQIGFEGAKVVDRYTYEIRLTRKYPQFIYWLAMSFFAPVPWEADVFYNQEGMKERNLSLDWYPVGTGPYMLTENNPNRRMVLERNPNFRGELFPERSDSFKVVGKTKSSIMPFIDKAHFSLEKESIPAWTKFIQGYYDSSGVVAESFDQTINFSSAGEPHLTELMSTQGIDLLTSTKSSISYLGFNMVDPILGGNSKEARLLRRAISIAIDYEELISVFANGRGLAAQGPLPPGIFGYLPGEEGINQYVYDWIDGRASRKELSEAQGLLKQAGYQGGIDSITGEPLTLFFDTVSSGPGSKAMLNWYRKQFKKLGIELVVRATDYNRFQEKVRKGNAQIFSWGWNADYPDPENFLFLLYGDNAKIVSQGENAVNYQNAEFDKLFLKIRSMPDSVARKNIITKMIEILRRDAPWVWGFHPTSYVLKHSWYGNADPNLMARNTLKYKTINPHDRMKKRRVWNTPIIWPVLLIASFLIVLALPAWFVYRARERARA
jgi:oligopeptide transport system substrate-binding protein